MIGLLFTFISTMGEEQFAISQSFLKCFSVTLLLAMFYFVSRILITWTMNQQSLQLIHSKHYYDYGTYHAVMKLKAQIITFFYIYRQTGGLT